LSELVRDAIDREYEETLRSPKRRDIEAIMKEVYKRYPDPPDLPPRGYDVHNRREARKAILLGLRRKRR